MARPITTKRATDDQNLKALELAEEHGSIATAVQDYALRQFAPNDGRGKTFTTLDIAEALGLHRSHVSGGLQNFRHDIWNLCKENRTHWYFEVRSSHIPLEEEKESELQKAPAYVLESFSDGSKLVWIEGKVYYASLAQLNVGDNQ